MSNVLVAVGRSTKSVVVNIRYDKCEITNINKNNGGKLIEVQVSCML